MIAHTAIPMMRLHNGLYDRKTDAAAAVFPRARLIYLVKLLPDFVDILLRNATAGIKNADPQYFLPISIENPNLFFTGHIVNGIAQIVRDDLLDLKLISPHKCLFLIKYQFNFILFQKKRGILDHSSNQFRNIKPVNRHCIIAEFQMVQREQFLNHLIHFSGLIHDHLAVEAATLRIIVDTLLQAFRISLNQRKRCFQFMRYVR